MNKPGYSPPRALADVLHKTLAEAFAKQGFASVELVTRWPEIVGAEIAAHSQPEKIQWPRCPQGRSPQGRSSQGQSPKQQSPQPETAPEPGTLLLRVEGPAALEIQHLSDVILERVNQFFGWRAVGNLRLRQAPLARRAAPKSPPAPDSAALTRIAATLPEIRDGKLRDALARLRAAMERD
jgi:hypothetical protein